jgi:hypothetical protein
MITDCPNPEEDRYGYVPESDPALAAIRRLEQSVIRAERENHEILPLGTRHSEPTEELSSDATIYPFRKKDPMARDHMAESDLLRKILAAAHAHHATPTGTGLAVFDGKLYVSSIVADEFPRPYGTMPEARRG